MSANLIFIDSDNEDEVQDLNTDEKINDISDSFNNLSLAFNKKLSKKERQDNGIFFTPKSARDIIFEQIKIFFNFNETNLNILEPSFGS